MHFEVEMEGGEVTTRIGRTIKVPVQKYVQKGVMNASKVARYKKKVASRKATKERVNKHREKKKTNTSENKTKKMDYKKKK